MEATFRGAGGSGTGEGGDIGDSVLCCGGNDSALCGGGGGDGDLCRGGEGNGARCCGSSGGDVCAAAVVATVPCLAAAAL